MTSPTNSQLRGLLRPDQTGNGAEVRAVTAFIPSKTNAAPKNLSIFAPDVADGLLAWRDPVEPAGTLRRAAAPIPGSTDSLPTKGGVPLTNRSARPVDENARGAPDFFGHVHFRRDELRREPGIQTN
jgi:hypothetical protein